MTEIKPTNLCIIDKQFARRDGPRQVLNHGIHATLLLKRVSVWKSWRRVKEKSAQETAIKVPQVKWQQQSGNMVKHTERHVITQNEQKYV